MKSSGLTVTVELDVLVALGAELPFPFELGCAFGNFVISEFSVAPTFPATAWHVICTFAGVLLRKYCALNLATRVFNALFETFLFYTHESIWHKIGTPWNSHKH